MSFEHNKPAQLGPDRRCGADSRGLEYRVYRDFAEIGPLQNEWNDLAGRAGDILSSFDWCEIWWKHFGRGRRLEIHTLAEAGRLVAVLPLFRETIRPGAIGLRTVRVVGCDYTIGTVGLCIEPGYVERFTRLVLEGLARSGAWDLLEIAPLRHYNTVVEAVGATCAASARVRTVIVDRYGMWETAFVLPATYEEYLASLPTKVHKEVVRLEQQLVESHQVEIRTVHQRDQVQPALEALIDLHQKRWTDRGQPGQLRDLPVQQFHRELAQRLVERNQLVLLTLTCHGQIIGASYGYCFGRRTHHLFTGNSQAPQWRRYGLGRIVYFHLIREAIAQRSAMLDDGRGIFEHKLSLGGQLYGERSLVVIRRGWGTRLRLWVALPAAYVIHVLYSRIWLDTIAARLGVKPKARHFFQCNWMLAQLFRRVGLRLFGRARVLEIACQTPAPPEHRGDLPVLSEDRS